MSIIQRLCFIIKANINAVRLKNKNNAYDGYAVNNFLEYLGHDTPPLSSFETAQYALQLKQQSKKGIQVRKNFNNLGVLYIDEVDNHTHLQDDKLDASKKILRLNFYNVSHPELRKGVLYIMDIHNKTGARINYDNSPEVVSADTRYVDRSRSLDQKFEEIIRTVVTRAHKSMKL
jgi:hypothetical protein